MCGRQAGRQTPSVVFGRQRPCFCDRFNGRMMKRNRELICISLFGGGFQWVLGGKTVHKLLLICAMILLIKIYLMFTRTKYDIHVDLNMHTTWYICLEFGVNGIYHSESMSNTTFHENQREPL